MESTFPPVVRLLAKLNLRHWFVFGPFIRLIRRIALGLLRRDLSRDPP
jgi:hypothetical protein